MLTICSCRKILFLDTNWHEFIRRFFWFFRQNGQNGWEVDRGIGAIGVMGVIGVIGGMGIVGGMGGVGMMAREYDVGWGGFVARFVAGLLCCGLALRDECAFC